MKRDLYRFAKARRYGERITLIEDDWWKKYNTYTSSTNVPVKVRQVFEVK